MKSRLVKLSSIAFATLLTTNAWAQAAAQAGASANTRAAQAPAKESKALTTAANAKIANPARAVTVTAAGSVIILTDGIVANARIAHIQPPAPGFVYER